MDTQNKEALQARKKAYKKAKKKAVRPWSIFTGIFTPFMVIFIAAAILVSMFDNTVALFLGATFWELVDAEPSIKFYESDYGSDEARLEAGYELVKQVEGEGAALLMNNGALPLKKGSSVSLFSTSSVNLVYGGTGSANVDASKADNLFTAMDKVGFHVNQTLWDFYLTGEGSKYHRVAADYTKGAEIGEAPWSAYTQDVLDSVAVYGDAAIVTLSRVGGEGADLEFVKSNYLALDENEKDMLANLKKLKENETIKSIILLINSSNPLQVDFLKENEYDVDAVLWIGGVGITGINAVAEILVGKINPSGSLVDTYCYDNYSSPAMKNFIPTTYVGYDPRYIPKHASTYMIYQEGIYVGYRYYETRYEDYVVGAGNAGDYQYSNDVAFPFGHGLSYTTFEYRGASVTYDEKTQMFTYQVTVTNTGTEAGKETVQVYVSSPYTEYDIENRIEKASVVLVGFEKTPLLNPGESKTMKVTVDIDDLASYDAYGTGSYILEAGTYYFTAATDSHSAVNNVLAKKGHTPEKTEGRMDDAGNSNLVCIWNNNQPSDICSVSDNGTKIVNQLSNADPTLNAGIMEDVVFLSRSDWMGTMPTGDILKLTLTQMLADALQDVQYDPSKYESVEMPTMGADNGLKLFDLIGEPYDDEDWDLLLDQMTFEEMVSFIGDAFHWTMPVESVSAPGTRDENGPQGLTVTLFGSGLDVETTALTSEDVLAATFNKELVYEMGKIVGNDCLAAEVTFLYGPGANTHRTPYGGRNFEYYSEDPYLSSAIGAAEVKGIEEKGVFVVIKHFALNDCEQDRIGLGVWLTEQAAREVYLKAFQGALEESQAGGNGVMMAYTRWGTQWSGANYGLVTGILKNEWGCYGLQITDNVLTTYVSGVDGVMAGTSAFDSMLAFYITGQLPKYENDPVVVTAMREACHQNLYAIANSQAMNGMGPNTTVKAVTPGVVTLCRVLAVVFSLLNAAAVTLWIIKRIQFKKSEAYILYHTPVAPVEEAPAEVPAETQAPAEE
ncbi:MAG: hypothetical protein E7438_03920 [Ruminococcaceae bacterium]|nr:hypothetical protein [Oscillospiraceae bacterium]